MSENVETNEYAQAIYDEATPFPALPAIEAATGSDVPTLSAIVRTRLYVGGLIVGALYGLISGAAVLLLDRPAAIVVVTLAGLVGTAYGQVTAGLGVAFRPTR